MAQSRPKEFVYRNIELYKSESLGSGSYGGVCKAKCDELLCAAKIMHATLFDQGNVGRDSYLSKFLEECHLLSLARHPNVVQYLGTYTDPDTRLPVLLMELCEESLTSFLEQSPGPLSYHVQVHICHDIVLALVYLHSNRLIHRDLTGNNVLIIAGPRAKITDFGMSRLASVNPRMTALTMCPGNALYMPPEALDEATSYTARLDVFSFGVLVIQILTRLFPNPTDRFRLVSVPQFEEPLRQEVPEIERRATHLKLIVDTHSLKQLALQCLKKKEAQRPSALELNNTISKLKISSNYAESVSYSKNNTEVQKLKEQLYQLNLFTESKSEDIENYLVRIRELERLVEDKERQLQERKKEHKTTKSKKEKQRSVERRSDAEQFVEEDTPPIRPVHSTDQRLKQPQTNITTEPESKPSQDGKEKPLAKKSKRSSRLRKKQPDVWDQDIVVKNEQPSPIVESPTFHIDKVEETNTKDMSQMRWKKGKNAPEAMKVGAAVAHGNIAYFRPNGSVKVYMYQTNQGVEQWSQLKDNPNLNCGLVIIDGLLTSVGGFCNFRFTNFLLSLQGAERREWCESLPPMPTPRESAACLTTKQHLVVAGGYGVQYALSEVEVMTTTTTKVWAKVAPLPIACSELTATVYRDTIYLAGGVNLSNSVFASDLPDLFSTARLGSKKQSQGQDIWREICHLPVKSSSLVSVAGNLIAVGGNDDSDKPTSTVHRYDPRTDSWAVVASQMKTKRSSCLAVSLATEDYLIVVGGWSSKILFREVSVTDSVEILN